MPMSTMALRCMERDMTAKALCCLVVVFTPPATILKTIQFSSLFRIFALFRLLLLILAQMIRKFHHVDTGLRWNVT